MDSYDIIWYVHIVYTTNIYVYHTLFFAIFVEMSFTTDMTSNSQENRLLQNVSNSKICWNSVLPFDIYIKTGSLCSLLTCPLSNDKYFDTCLTYYKYEKYKS